MGEMGAWKRNTSPRHEKTVWVPSVCRMPASSTAMYPAPTTNAFFGCVAKSKNPSDVMQCSAPGGGVGGRLGGG